MKVLLCKNVAKLGRIGDIVDVKTGYARNYLLPQQVGVLPTPATIRAVEADKARYLAELARQKSELQAQADLIQGREVTIAARANEEGHLYGSVGPAQICEALAKEGLFIDPEYVALESPIRQLDKYDVLVRFAEDVTATVHVWVVPVHDENAPAEGTLPVGEAPADAPPAEGAAGDEV